VHVGHLTFCPHSAGRALTVLPTQCMFCTDIRIVFVCLHTVNWFGFVMEAQCVYCEARTEHLYGTSYISLGLRRREPPRQYRRPQPKYSYLPCPNFINAQNSGSSSTRHPVTHCPLTLVRSLPCSVYFMCGFSKTTKKSGIHPHSHVMDTGGSFFRDDSSAALHSSAISRCYYFTIRHQLIRLYNWDGVFTARYVLDPYIKQTTFWL
jgi:hypothetical protein